MKYLVTFGAESKEVVAANEGDAWCEFCAIVPSALKHPNLHPRSIVEVPEVVVADEPAALIDAPEVAEAAAEEPAAEDSPSVVIEDLPAVEEPIEIPAATEILNEVVAEVIEELAEDEIDDEPTELADEQ